MIPKEFQKYKPKEMRNKGEMIKKWAKIKKLIENREYLEQNMRIKMDAMKNKLIFSAHRNILTSLREKLGHCKNHRGSKKKMQMLREVENSWIRVVLQKKSESRHSKSKHLGGWSDKQVD